jgi:hypothetical protein
MSVFDIFKNFLNKTNKAEHYEPLLSEKDKLNNRKYNSVMNNVDGPFYVKEGCCTYCSVPMVETPDLFGGFEEKTESFDGCWVKKQPDSEDALNRMYATMECQELDCIRYCGKSKIILDKLNKLKLEHLIDEN